MSPRGNDAAAAGDAFVEKFGVPANAEHLIRQSTEYYTPEYQRASLGREDAEASAKLDDDEVLGKLDLDDKDATVLSTAVRGDFLGAVVEHSDGTTRKYYVRNDGKSLKEDAAERDKRAAAQRERRDQPHREAKQTPGGIQPGHKDKD